MAAMAWCFSTSICTRRIGVLGAQGPCPPDYWPSPPTMRAGGCRRGGPCPPTLHEQSSEPDTSSGEPRRSGKQLFTTAVCSLYFLIYRAV